MDGWMNGWMDGWMDGWTDKWTIYGYIATCMFYNGQYVHVYFLIKYTLWTI